MKVAIIGAGPSGLACVRHCLEEGVECVAFEQIGNIGGVWNYTDNTDVDENGVPVISPMYQELCTNLPKELMEFENFPYQKSDNYYISQPEVLEYIEKFAKHFHLLPHIKLLHQVVQVDPLPSEKWRLKVRNVKTNDTSEDIYDGVIVCNGHTSHPYLPSLPGMDDFQGRSIHSLRYRKPDDFANKIVLVIGGGPSGLDISRLINDIATKVYLSFDELKGGNKAEGVIPKPKASCIKQHSVVFEDETEEEIDVIIYCTGYIPAYPFLSKACQITVDDCYVTPLYKQIINIEHPTMAIINITLIVCPFPMYSLQVRFFLAFLKKQFYISKKDMYENLNQSIKEAKEKRLPLKFTRVLALKQNEYCETLAEIANVKGVPKVYGKMFAYILTHKEQRWRFNILNDEDFEPIPT